MKSGSGGTGYKDALLSTAKAVQDFNGESSNETTSENRMRQVADHNGALAKHFANWLFHNHRIAALPLARSTTRRGGTARRDTWRWNGIVTIPNPPERLMAYFFPPSGKGPVTLTRIETEPWRQPEGAAPAHERYLVRAFPGAKNKVRQADLRKDHVKLPGIGAIRFCFHYFHDEYRLRWLEYNITRAMAAP
jgi:hypothetical protein